MGQVDGLGHVGPAQQPGRYRMFAAKIHRHPTQREAADAAGGGNYAGLVKPVLTVTAAGDDATRGMDGETIATTRYQVHAASLGARSDKDTRGRDLLSHSVGML